MDAELLSLAHASIVHDLRNPLGTIYTGAEMLLAFDNAPPQVKRLAGNIFRAASRMRDLLTDLATEIRLKPPFEVGDIREIVAAASEAASLAEGNQRVHILLDFPGPIRMPMVRTLIESVFFNLITNALQAMPTGGEVRVTARQSTGVLLVEVEDNGPGIPRSIRGRLFERFVTADKANGLGLGLALCRETVRNHGGDMWIEPAPGARFVIRLPLNRDVAPQTGPDGSRRNPLVDTPRFRLATRDHTTPYRRPQNQRHDCAE
jgi:two-component system sensor histidine kinase HydH